MRPQISLGGVDEYQLENGMRVLLIPDQSQPSVTVNIVFCVGSRHERRGERGMAHLLEHMLFKATPSFANIPQALRDRGARFNGTTWLDRTHYYETLRSSDDALDFALQLELERMTKVEFHEDVFKTEIGVVKNELLRGENQPSRVLFQRVMAAAYASHGYGHPTIGFLEDLDAMHHDDLRRFYVDHYQPRNATLVIAGDFDVEKALKKVESRFAGLENHETIGDANELAEPPQDGEREVSLHRVCNVGEWIAAYHVPSGGHRDFPCLQLWALAFAQRPTGELYKRLIETKLATDLSCLAFSLHDPGLFIASLDVAEVEKFEQAQLVALEVMENRERRQLDERTLERAKNEMLKRRELEVSDSSRLAVALTEFISLGDWRYYFLQREAYASITVEQMQLVADRYFRAANRTIGKLLPRDREQKIVIQARSESDLLESSLDQIRPPVSGKPFDSDPVRIQKSIQSITTEPHELNVAMVEHETRSELTTLLLQFRMGDQEAYSNRHGQSGFLGSWMQRGSKRFDQEQVQDELRRMRGWLSCSGFRGGVQIEGQVPREFATDWLALVESLVREPLLDPKELELLKASDISDLDQRRAQPTAIAANRLNRELSPYPYNDARYVPTLEERKEFLTNTTANDVAELYRDFFSARFGEAIAIGPKMDSEFGERLKAFTDGWEILRPYERIAQPYIGCEGDSIEIPIADKANVALSAGMNLQMQDSNDDFPRLMVANYIFGGATLVSRLSQEVRQKRGLSYSIYSQFDAHMIDERGRLSIQATTNPEHWRELKETVHAELQRIVNDGVTQAELEQARGSMLDSRYVSRANPRNLANIVATNLFSNRTLKFTANLEQRILDMSVQEIHEAIQRWWDPDKMVYVVCGTL